MSNIPISYRQQNGCHNCKHVFEYKEHDCGSTYYCTLGAPKRPMCMSVQLGEHPIPYDHDLQDRMHKEWDDWTTNRSVDVFGICDYWSEQSNAF